MKTPARILSLLAALIAAAALQAQTPVPAPAPAPDPAAKKEKRTLIIKSDDMPGEKTVFLGVETTPASAALISQLNLDKGTTLLVRSVLPKSPAAGLLQENDLLLKLDDQVLIEPRQLAVLVRNHKDGDEVTVTYLRGGKPATAKITLRQRETSRMVVMHGAGSGKDGRRVTVNIDDTDNRAEVDRMLALMDEKGDSGAKRRTHAGAAGDPGMNSLTVLKSNSMIVSNDETGSLILTIKDGKKTLEVKNPKGDTLFSGSVDTPEQRKALPADVATRLEKVESMQGVRFETDGDFKGREVKPMKAPATSTALPLELMPLRTLLPTF